MEDLVRVGRSPVIGLGIVQLRVRTHGPQLDTKRERVDARDGDFVALRVDVGEAHRESLK